VWENRTVPAAIPLRAVLALSVLSALAAPVATASAATTFVPNRFDDPIVGGTSCGPPAPPNSCSLRGAVAAASAGDTIDLSTGQYTLSQNELEVAENLKIVGDGPSATTIKQTAPFRVIEVEISANLTMSGVTITGGHVTGGDGADGAAPGEKGENGGSAHGAGIEVSGTLTLTDAVVSGNTTTGGAGGDGASNAGGGGGEGGRGGSAGGAGIGGGTVVLTRVAIVNNVAQPGPAGDGGDASLSGPGGAGGKGGAALGAGASAGASPMTITDSLIAGNEARTTSGGQGGNGGPIGGIGGEGGQGEASDGGGLFGNGVVKLTNVTLTANLAEGGKAGNGGNARNEISATNGGEGGAAFGGSGGAVALFNGAEGRFASTTFASNSTTAASAGAGGAGESGGNAGAAGIAFPARGGNVVMVNATLAVRDTILSAGKGAVGAVNCGFGGGGTLESLGHNLEDGEECIAAPAAGDLSNTPAGLGSLQDNGGPTETMALLAGSAAIDAGETACTNADGALLKTDQRGLPRLSPCDIGAFEVQPAPPPGPPPPPPVPALTDLKVSPHKVRNGKKATISFTLNVAARVSFVLQRKLPGAKVGGKCVRRTRKLSHRKACRRLVRIKKGVPKAFAAQGGANKRRWAPRRLIPGGYKLSATPVGGETTGTGFRVRKPRRR
jgi:hypothetical protein